MLRLVVKLLSYFIRTTLQMICFFQVKKIAPDFYDDLPYYTSWCKVLWDFVFDPAIGPYARVRREIDLNGKITEHIKEEQRSNGVENKSLKYLNGYTNGITANGHSKNA